MRLYMATKRPAKLAIGKKEQNVKLHPVTGKQMTAVKVLRKTGASGMYWVTIDDFKGDDATVNDMISVR